MERLRRIAIDLFLMAAIGALLALAGPFGSGAMPAGPRFLFWVGFVLAGYCLFMPVSRIGDWAAQETRLPRWLAVALTALVAALPLSLLIALALGRLAPGADWFGERFLILYVQVAGLGLAINLAMLALRRSPAAPPEPAAAAGEAEDSRPPFLRRLPPAVAADLLCLEMQDHYVKAHGGAASAMLLMRFRDAIAELDGAGLRVHRSWWVAHGAVEAAERDGRALRLRLRNGLSVPVSRAFHPAVRAAGWTSGAA